MFLTTAGSVEEKGFLGGHGSYLTNANDTRIGLGRYGVGTFNQYDGYYVGT
jgi:hypothetical protein